MRWLKNIIYDTYFFYFFILKNRQRIQISEQNMRIVCDSYRKKKTFDTHQELLIITH